MWEWFMRIFSPPHQPLDHPKPLMSEQGLADGSDMDQIRKIQTAADTLITNIRSRKEIEERARQRIIEKQANPRGIGRERPDG